MSGEPITIGILSPASASFFPGFEINHIDRLVSFLFWHIAGLDSSGVKNAVA